MKRNKMVKEGFVERKGEEEGNSVVVKQRKQMDVILPPSVIYHPLFFFL